MKTLGNLVEKVSNDSELKGNPETQTAIGHYLAMVVNLIIVSSKVGKFLNWLLDHELVFISNGNLLQKRFVSNYVQVHILNVGPVWFPSG